MSVFVNQTQMFPYYQLGAAGCWSFNVWMGPSPVMSLRDACFAEDWETRQADLSRFGRHQPGRCQHRQSRPGVENVFKLAVNEADYCTAGPLRAPWRIVPEEVISNSKKIAAYWNTLCEKYPAGEKKRRKKTA